MNSDMTNSRDARFCRLNIQRYSQPINVNNSLNYSSRLQLNVMRFLFYYLINMTYQVQQRNDNENNDDE